MSNWLGYGAEVEPLRIERSSIAELPSVDYLVHLAHRAEWLLLQVPAVVTVVADGEWFDPTQADRERLVQELAERLPKHDVWDSSFMPDQATFPREQSKVAGTTIPGLSRLSIHSVISEQAVAEHLEFLDVATARYSTLANSLMQRLARQFCINISEFTEDALWNKREQSGRLASAGVTESEWRYFFHGWDCGFTQVSTGLMVEARLGAGAECGPDFGVLNAGFLLHFINTSTLSSPEFLSLAELFRNYANNAHRALTIMEKRGFLHSVSLEYGHGTEWIRNEIAESIDKPRQESRL